MKIETSHLIGTVSRRTKGFPRMSIQNVRFTLGSFSPYPVMKKVPNVFGLFFLSNQGTILLNSSCIFMYILSNNILLVKFKTPLPKHAILFCTFYNCKKEKLFTALVVALGEISSSIWLWVV